ncbi:hypothetical protein VKT23_002354 [Stygiomarasmius scandens]|uniref:Uncharacterized protein n=1 Tax=Marasmiellus scandens TaxID=2682957 RepID=A0ABR1K239_9AGAR
MFRGLSHYYPSSTQPPANYAFHLKHNLSHLLARYPNNGDGFQVQGYAKESQVAETRHVGAGLNGQEPEASSTHASSSAESTHSNEAMLLARAGDDININSHGITAGPSMERHNDNHEDRDVEIVDLTGDDTFDENSMHEVEPLFGEDLYESESEKDDDSNKTEPSSEVDIYQPFQQIQNSSSPSSSRLSLSKSTSYHAYAPTSPICPTSPTVSHSYIMTSKKQKSKKPRKAKTQSTAKQQIVKSRVYKSAHKGRLLNRFHDQPNPPSKPKKYLYPDLPIKKITVVHWVNTLNTARFVLEKGDDTLQEAMHLDAVIRAIQRFQNDLSAEFVAKIAPKLKYFKHRTGYDDLYHLKTRARTRSILDFWGQKFFGQSIYQDATAANLDPQPQVPLIAMWHARLSPDQH